MAIPRKPRKRKSPAREKAISAAFVRELLDDIEAVDRALATAKICAEKDNLRDGIKSLLEVVAQQGTVLRDLLLALEEDSDPLARARRELSR
jgi:molecular chaperone GrpE (heat shock protein)